VDLDKVAIVPSLAIPEHGVQSSPLSAKSLTGTYVESLQLRRTARKHTPQETQISERDLSCENHSKRRFIHITSLVSRKALHQAHYRTFQGYSDRHLLVTTLSVSTKFA
jgi:hypothetical protein